MRKYFCLDVSGSMSSQAISMAVEKINAEVKHGDFFLMFDCDAYGPWPVEDALGKVYGDPEDMIATLCAEYQHKGRGGTDARSALKMIEEHSRGEAVHKVLVSDGFLVPEEKAMFDAFIEIDDRKAEPAAPSA
jgi:hypothetical protein